MPGGVLHFSMQQWGSHAHGGSNCNGVPLQASLRTVAFVPWAGAQCSEKWQFCDRTVGGTAIVKFAAWLWQGDGGLVPKAVVPLVIPNQRGNGSMKNQYFVRFSKVRCQSGKRKEKNGDFEHPQC